MERDMQLSSLIIHDPLIFGGRDGNITKDWHESYNSSVQNSRKDSQQMEAGSTGKSKNGW